MKFSRYWLISSKMLLKRCHMAEQLGSQPELINRRSVLIIEDTGEGIAECDLKRMFQPFWTTKGSSGTGLGLVVSQRIINDHGGEISVKSDVGAGTSFKVEIPAARSILDESERSIDTVLEKNLRILVIDDSKQIVTLLQDLLTGYGQTVLGGLLR